MRAPGIGFLEGRGHILDERLAGKEHFNAAMLINRRVAAKFWCIHAARSYGCFYALGAFLWVSNKSPFGGFQKAANTQA